MKNDQGKSDKPVVPEKPANKADAETASVAESVEERGLAKGNPQEQTRRRAQHRIRLQHALERIRKAIQKDKKMKLTNLWTHVCDVARLREAYYGLNSMSVPGIDDVWWFEYGEELEKNLNDLRERLRTGSCDRTYTGRRFIVLRQTISKRMRAKLKEIKEELRKRMHMAVSEIGKWLRSVVNGYYRYHSVPRNLKAMKSFYREIGLLWHAALSRRSHKANVDWRRMFKIITRWIPTPYVTHPYPEQRFGVTTLGRSPVR